MKTQLHIFLTALMFYTRIPCPIKFPHSEGNLNKASRYFPLIGWIVGGLSFIGFAIGFWLFNISIAVALSLLVGVLVTGGFHEDGLADSADGFGGGWNKTKILTIMKDSRIGAYGVIALVLMFLIKYSTLVHLCQFLVETTHPTITLNLYLVALSFISYHALARLTAISMVFISTYAREDATSKVKPIAKSYGLVDVIGALFFGIVPLLVLVYFVSWTFIAVLVPLVFLVLYAKYYFEKWLDGYTGDCLGALEQLSECMILLSFCVVWKFL